MASKALQVLDLFAGIGGFSYALEHLCGGFETVAFVEIDDFCQRVLAKNFPGVPIYADITEFDATEWRGQIDVVTGGPPCQPASLAGRRLGKADARWLWPQAIRVVRECRPKWICFENPDGIYGVGLQDILDDLESLGYSNCQDESGGAYIAPIEIPAGAAQASHERNRVWIIAHTEHNAGRWRAQQRPGRNRRSALSCPDGQDFRNASDAGSVGLAQRRGLQSRRQDADATTAAFDRRQTQPGMVRGVHGVSRRLDEFKPVLQRDEYRKDDAKRIAALGNAVYPPVVAEIGRAILAAESHNVEVAA